MPSLERVEFSRESSNSTPKTCGQNGKRRFQVSGERKPIQRGGGGGKALHGRIVGGAAGFSRTAQPESQKERLSSAKRHPEVQAGGNVYAKARGLATKASDWDPRT